MRAVKKLYLLILCCCLSTAYGQDRTLRFFDLQTRLPIADVHVTSSHRIFVSDSSGTVQVPANAAIIEVSHVQYEPRTIDLKKQSHQQLFYLTEQLSQLQEIHLSTTLENRLHIHELKSLQRGILGSASVLINGKIYLFGGDHSIIKNGFLNAFKETGDYGSPAGQTAPGEMSAIAFRNKTYLKHSSDIWCYDIMNNTWNLLASKTLPRANHSAVYHHGKVYLSGGRRFSKNQTREYLADQLEIFDPITQQITLPTKSKHLATNTGVISFENYLIYFGGRTKRKEKTHFLYKDDITLYKPTTDKWYRFGSLPSPQEIQCLSINHQIYGLSKTGKQGYAISSFDIETNTWKVLKTLPKKINNPGFTSDGHHLYLLHDNFLYSYHPGKNQLRKYRVNAPFEGASLFYFNESIYVVGGYIPEVAKKIPSKKVFSIDLSQLPTTRFYRL